MNESGRRAKERAKQAPCRFRNLTKMLIRDDGDADVDAKLKRTFFNFPKCIIQIAILFNT